MSGKPPPDFAVLRAAEVLAQMHRAQRRKPVVVEHLDEQVTLRCERLSFAVNQTQRSEVERAFGVAFAYPARGWHTYATKESGKRCFLSAFYKDATLIAVELYVPVASHAPPLAPMDIGGFELLPRYLRIGMDAANAFEAQFPGGAVYVKARTGAIDRIAIYASAAPA